MTNVKLSGLNADDCERTCPIGPEIPLVPEPTPLTKLANIAENLLLDSTDTISFSDYTKIRELEREYVFRRSILNTKENGPPFHLFPKDPDKLTKGERCELKEFSEIIEESDDKQDECYTSGLLYLTKIFQYELSGEPLNPYFKELIYKLHHNDTELYRFANSTADESYRLYLSYEAVLDGLPVTHQAKCISRLNGIIKGLLPECPRSVHYGHFYASEILYLNEDDVPPFDIFSKEIEKLTEQEEERFLLFKFIFAVLENRDDLCDKVGILYLVRVFQYEIFGHQLSLHFKELIQRQRKKNIGVFKLAENIAKESYQLYLEGATIEDLDSAILPVCSITQEDPICSESEPTDKLLEITNNLLPNCAADYTDELRPLYFSEVLMSVGYSDELIGIDKDPPFHLFAMDKEELIDEETENIKEVYMKELQPLGRFFGIAGDVQDLCDKGGLLYFVKILHYVLLGKPLGSAFKYLEFYFDEEEKPDDAFFTLAASIALRSYELFKLQESG